MKKFTVFVACLGMASFASTALGDVSGESLVPGSWTGTDTGVVYSSSITLADPGGNTTITDVTVGVVIDHTQAVDITMILDDGTNSVIFIAQQGGGSDYASQGLFATPAQGIYDFNDAGIPFPAGFPIPGGTAIATDSPLIGAFGSSDATWTLTILDDATGDGGVIGFGPGLIAWDLTLTTVPEPTSFVLLGLAGGMALVLRRKR